MIIKKEDEEADARREQNHSVTTKYTQRDTSNTFRAARANAHSRVGGKLFTQSARP